MKASEITFEQMRKGGKLNPDLGVPLSYMQVEFGLVELEGCWEGFRDSSDDHNIEFKNRKEICAEFGKALTGYLEHIGEPLPLKVGS